MLPIAMPADLCRTSYVARASPARGPRGLPVFLAWASLPMFAVPSATRAFSPHQHLPPSRSDLAREPAPGVISTERSKWRNLFRLVIARSPPHGAEGLRTTRQSDKCHIECRPPLVTPSAPRTDCRRACCCLSEMPLVSREQAQLVRGKSRGLLEIVIASPQNPDDATAKNI